MKCPNCHVPNQEQGESCSKCGKDIVSPGERALALATLVQSQDSITWVAFSLAMTLESILLVGFFQLESKVMSLGITGLILAIAFFLLVAKSNHAMKKHYDRASEEFPSIFHYERKGCVDELFFTILKARLIMPHVFLAWIAGWLLVLLL